jgi:hypothetical protein
VNKISFVEIHKIDPRYKPVPSSKLVPNWYQRMTPYVNNVKSPTGMTVKRCIPVFDAIVSGYTILLPADIFITFEYQNGQRAQKTEWSQALDFDLIETHAPQQFSTYPGVVSNLPAKKLVNPFGIITPPGYSCLFTQPMHQDSSPIKVFEGIVDTDQQHIINFPFMYKDTNFEGVIPAGTPIVQIVPFKREKWTMDFDNKKDIKKLELFKRKIGSKLFGQYRDLLWTRKEYK